MSQSHDSLPHKPHSKILPVFSVSGNQILGLYEGFSAAGLRIVHMRHESAAAYAAAGWAHAAGELGVVLVAGGPGFLASFVGVSVAASMELPLLWLSGGPPSDADRPGAFQYVDQAKMASAICKRTFKIASIDAIERILTEASTAALEGIPGPVHVLIPADVAQAGAKAIAAALIAPRPHGNGKAPESADLRKIADALAAAKRPLVIVRPSASRGRAGQALGALCGRLGVPPVVMESPRGSEDLKFRAVAQRYADADYALVVGPADFSVHFLSDAHLARGGRIALIDADGDPEPARALDVHVRAEPQSALEALVQYLPDGNRVPWITADGSEETASSAAALHPLEAGRIMREALAPDALVVLDGGEFCQWVRLALAAIPNDVTWNSRVGAIGGSIPLALGMALAQPERHVLAAIGDGAFGYHGAEIETAVREGIRFTLVVGNDDRWGAEWHTQREKYGRAVATMLSSVSYDEVARGFGALGYSANDAAELRKTLALAGGADEPVCINIRIASVRSPATAP